MTRCEWTTPGRGRCPAGASKTVLWTEPDVAGPVRDTLERLGLDVAVTPSSPATNQLDVCAEHADAACLAFPDAAVFDLEGEPT